jgi:hypothetical protein
MASSAEVPELADAVIRSRVAGVRNFEKINRADSLVWLC